MKVCYKCLESLVSHEGEQEVTEMFVDENDEFESCCDWCSETGFDVLYEIKKD